MFKDIDGYLRYYRGLHKRTLRDVGALPPAAESYKPETGEGENSWSIGEIIRHMAGSRLYFSRAYRGEGWYFGDPIRECTCSHAMVSRYQSDPRRVGRISGPLLDRADL